jgi:hypothetical protein
VRPGWTWCTSRVYLVNTLGTDGSGLPQWYETIPTAARTESLWMEGVDVQAAMSWLALPYALTSRFIAGAVRVIGRTTCFTPA